MSALARLQDGFQHYLLTLEDGFAAEIIGTGRIDAATRLGIYADAYRLRLLEALETDFPGLLALVGAEEFDRLGRRYIDRHPSAHFSIRWFGRHLAGFLRTTPPYDEHPAVAEMAAFEWAMTEAFDAADAAAVTVADMAALPAEAWADLRFTTHPTLQRLDLSWNVTAIWNAINADQDPPDPEPGEFPCAWLVWRQDLGTRFRSLDVAEAWALDALARGANFAALCEGLCEWIAPGHAAAQAAGLLKRWIEDGLIAGLVVE